MGRRCPGTENLQVLSVDGTAGPDRPRSGHIVPPERETPGSARPEKTPPSPMSLRVLPDQIRGPAQATGTSTVTVVPSPGIEPISSRPPTIRARSWMPGNPKPVCARVGTKPVPSSWTDARTIPPTRSMRTITSVAPECLTALSSLVAKTYARADIANTCGSDLAKWRGYLAKDHPRSLRATEIRTYVDTHQEQQRVSVGRDKLIAARDYLDLAGKDLQAWCDDKTFIPPLGFSKKTIETLLHDVKLLHFGVNKAMPGL